MIYKEFQPSVHLSGYIKCFWIMKDSNNFMPQTPDPILPDGCPEIVFNLSAPFSRLYDGITKTQPQSIIVGQMNRFVLIEPSKQANLFGIRFHPFGLSAFIKESVNSLTDKIEEIESVFNNTGKELEEKINEAKTTKERICIFEQTFEKLLSEKNVKYESFIDTAINLIQKSNGQNSVEHLTDKLGINIKQTERIFKRLVGLTPKKFSRIIRLQKLTQFISANEVNNWANVAQLFGYFDQAHFIKDFKSFSGNTPSTFIQKETQMTDFFVS